MVAPTVDATPLTIQQCRNVTLTFTNTTMMWHPIHVHGHTVEVIKPDRSPGASKDTRSFCR